VKKTKKGPQKIEASFAGIEAQLLARQELLASSGRVEETWRTYRQRRFGPYYRLVFRENKQKRSIYLGRCSVLAERVRRFLADLQRPARECRYLRRLRRKTRAALRLETKTLAAYLAPLGFHVKGGLIRRRRAVKVGWDKQSAVPPNPVARQEKELASPVHSHALPSMKKTSPRPTSIWRKKSAADRVATPSLSLPPRGKSASPIVRIRHGFADYRRLLANAPGYDSS
jgi:hypothetical protein